MDTHAFQDTESRTQFSRGYDRGNYGNAYESGDWDTWSERNEFNERSQPYREGMLLGYFSSYEMHEISEDIRDQVEALRVKHGEE